MVKCRFRVPRLFGILVLMLGSRCLATTILSEDFSSGIPAAWSTVQNSPGESEWVDLAGCGLANFTGGTGDAACFITSSLGQDAELVSPSFDLSGYPQASLDFLLNADLGYLALDVDASTNGGTTWGTLVTFNTDQGGFQALPGVPIQFDLSSYLVSNVTLRWHVYGGIDEEQYVEVDNVLVTAGVPEPATGLLVIVGIAVLAVCGRLRGSSGVRG